jgi:hypothetical protein
MYLAVDQNGQFSSKTLFGPQKCSCRCESPPNQGSNPHHRSRGPNKALLHFDYRPPKIGGGLIIRTSRNLLFSRQIKIPGTKRRFFRGEKPVVLWISGHFVSVITFRGTNCACTQKLAVWTRLDASYNLRLKVGSKILFWRKYDYFSFHKKIVELLLHAIRPRKQESIVDTPYVPKSRHRL